MPMPKRASINGQWIKPLTGSEKVEAHVAHLETPTGAGIELSQHRTPGAATDYRHSARDRRENSSCTAPGRVGWPRKRLSQTLLIS